MVISYLLLKQ